MAAVVRRYEPADLPGCRALWAQLTEWHRELYADETIGGSDPGSAFDAHLAAVGSEWLWVAEVDGDVVGLAGLIDQREKVELEPVVVARDHRGRGTGRRLVEAAIEAARAAGVRQVVVRPVGRNADAIRFFHALGFDVLGRVDIRVDLHPATRRAGERIAARSFRV